MAATLQTVFRDEEVFSHLGQIPVSAPQSQMMDLLAFDGPILSFQHEDLHVWKTESYLYGWIELPATGIEASTLEGYTRIFGLLRAHPTYQVLRLWHYIPGINAIDDGMERYRRFSRARYQVFQEANYAMATDLPAATAIGIASGFLVIHFIAGTGETETFENPRQMSAYQYPPEYGPKSPSFSRSMSHRNGRSDVFFISGTASILGHRSIAPNDISRQTFLTLENIEALLECGSFESIPKLKSNAYWRVYFRNPDDESAIRSIILGYIHSQSHVEFMRGDICRKDLGVEIEGMILNPKKPLEEDEHA